jgi:glutathione S-transferase
MSSTEALRLYGDAFYISPYVFSVYVALREKALEFEYVPVALHEAAQKQPDYAKRSLTGRVPALEHGAFCLAESSAIVEYLDDAFAATAKMLPTAVRERARARQLMAWIRSDLMPIREERATTTMFYQRAERPLSSAAQAAAQKLITVAEALIAAPDAFLFGDFSLADADLSFMLQRLILNGDTVPPAVSAWAAHVWARPTVQEFVSKQRPPYIAYQY